jgi:hypothetical protein
MPRRVLFAVDTPLGYRVVLPRNRWREIVRFKHPALDGKQELVRRCLREPDTIRASSKDSEIHLFYRFAERGHLCVVVAGDDPKERFVVTAYLTEHIKRGEELWTK